MSFKLPSIVKNLLLTFWQLRLIACLIVLSLLTKAQAQEETINKWFGSYQTNQYAIRLSVDEKVIERIRKNKHLFQFGIYYISDDSLNSAVPQLSIGFFADPGKASKFLGSKQFAAAKTTTRISQTEHGKVLRNYTTPDANSDTYVFYLQGENSEENDKIILNKARSLYVAGKYQQALIVYLLLSVFSEGETAAWALELSGLSYEKQGNLKQAIQQYRTLLDTYPGNSGNQRVEQRLRALETAAENTKNPLNTANNGKQKYDVFYRGVLTQNFQSASKTINDGDSEEIVSALSNDFDFRASKRGNTHEFSFRTNGFILQDDINEDRDYNRLRRAYVSYHHRPTGLDAVVGRQREFNSGVFTSFDGLTLGLPVFDLFTVSVSAGKPVYFTRFYEDLDYDFYSLHSEMNVGKNWRINAYVTQQTVNGITDREAVGFRTSFIGERLSSSLMVDYDTAFSELNSLVFNGQYKIGGKTDITASYGQQRSPFLTSTNVFIGQADIDIDQYLRSQENQETLLDDALDRTSLSTYQSLSLSRELDENIDIIFDYYQSDLSEIPSGDFLLGDAPLVTESFNQQSYGVRLLAQQIFGKNDILNVGVKQGENDRGENTFVFLNEKIRFGRRFSLHPKLSYISFKFNDNTPEQQRTRYSLYLSFRPTRNTEFSLEAGDETTVTEDNQQKYNTRYYFGSFRLNF